MTFWDIRKCSDSSLWSGFNKTFDFPYVSCSILKEKTVIIDAVNYTLRWDDSVPYETKVKIIRNSDNAEIGKFWGGFSGCWMNYTGSANLYAFEDCSVSVIGYDGHATWHLES